MNIFVTGSTGFLGQHLCSALLKRNHRVIGLCRDRVQQDDYFGQILVFGDISSVAFLERVIAEYEIEAVFHLAAQTGVGVAVKDPIGTLETNVRGTWNVLEACRRQGVRHVITASSDKAYSDGPVPYVEDQALRPHGIYATSKACEDFVAQSYAKAYKLPVAITRCGNLYGPGHTNWTTLIPGTIRSVLRGERPVVRSNGSPKRDFLFIEDAVRGYLAVLNNRVTGAWNFGTGTPHTVFEVISLICSIMGASEDLDIQDAAGGEIQNQFLDWHKASEGLGWMSEHTLRQGLEKTIPWYRELFELTARGIL